MDDLAEISARLSALELLVAFQFAAQHMQTADPAGAIRRLSTMLLEPATDGSVDAVGADARGILTQLETMIRRIAELQEGLPKRLVD